MRSDDAMAEHGQLPAPLAAIHSRHRTPSLAVLATAAIMLGLTLSGTFLWLLAFGSVLCARIGTLRFLAFSISGGIAGALLFLALNPGLAAPVIGASGAVAAMMGGVMRFLFNAIDRGQGYLLRKNPAAIPRVPLCSALRDPRIVFFSIVFIAINLLTTFGFGRFGASGAVAWQAHVGGYLFGLLTFSAFDTAPQNHSPHSLEVD